MKPLIIGEDTGNIDYGTGRALGHSAWRYAGAMGISVDRFFEEFDTVNLFPDREQKWDDKLVAWHVLQLRTEMARRQVVLYAGKRVARAFEGRDLDFFEFPDFALGDVAPPALRSAIPHSSGRNHYWNDAEKVRDLGAFLKLMVDLAFVFSGPSRLDSGKASGS